MEEATRARAEEILRFDPWLSGVLGREAFQLMITDEPLTSEVIEGGLAEVRAVGGFCSAKVPASDVTMVSMLEDLGFRLVTTATTFEKAIESQGEDDGWRARVRHAAPADRDEVVKIAHENFEYSRFHADPMIEQEVADATRAAWVENFFVGQRGDALIVGVDGERPTGFNLLLKDASGTLFIDLIVVGSAYRGRGFAKDMIRGAEVMCGGGCARYRVVTQAANVASIRLYEKLGFRLISAKYVLHYHGKRSPDG